MSLFDDEYDPSYRDYDNEPLDFDPYDDWVDADEDDESDPDAICSTCQGSGEGQHEGTTCYSCKGSGTERLTRK